MRIRAAPHVLQVVCKLEFPDGVLEAISWFD